MEAYKYKAFISYSHADEIWARWLHRSLESYRVPKRIVEKYALGSNRLTPVFRDHEELGSSSSLSASIERALEDSENLIVVCSPNSADSTWVNEEIAYYRRLGRAEHIFCVLLGEPGLSFPVAVLQDVDADGYATSEENEPLAADPRPEGDGKTHALTKIVSGMLDIPLDDLRQRESRRRSARLASAALASFAGMIVASALATYAFLAQKEANEQRLIAEREAQVANEVTNFLTDMLGSQVPDKARGATVTVNEALKIGVQMIEGRSMSDPIVEKRLLITMANAFIQLGQYDEAKPVLLEAADRERQSSTERDFDAIYLLGNIAFFEGLFDEAEQLYAECLERSLKYHGPEYTGNMWLRRLLIGVYIEQQRYELARREARSLMDWHVKLYGNLSAEVLYLRSAIVASYIREKNFDDTDVVRESEAILSSFSNHSEIRGGGPDGIYTIQALGNHAMALHGTGQTQEAEQLLREAIETGTRVFGDQHSQVWHHRVRLAELYKDRRKFERARELLVAEPLTQPSVERRRLEALAELDRIQVESH